jgi:hypothetical protein
MCEEMVTEIAAKSVPPLFLDSSAIPMPQFAFKF